MEIREVRNKSALVRVALTSAKNIFLWWREFDWTIKKLVSISAIAGVISYFTGSLQAVMFDGEPIEWVVQLHKTYGTTSSITL